MSSDPQASEQKGQPMTFVAAAIWTVVVVLLDGVIVGMTEAGREGAALDIVSRTASETIACGLVLFGILRVHEPETSVRHVLALRRTPIVAILLCAVIGVAISLPSEWMGQVLDLKFPRPPEEQEAYDQFFSVATTGRRVALFTTLVIVEPIVAELFYRGALFTPLRRTRDAETVVVATAAFETLSSFSPRTMMLLLVASLVFSWIRSATGSVFPSIVGRMAYAATSVVPLVVGRDLPKPTKLWISGTIFAAVAGLFGLAVLSRNAGARRLDASLEARD